MMTCSGSDAATVLARLIASSGPGSAGGGGAASVRAGLVPAATWSASRSRAASTSWSGSARTMTEQPGGDEVAGPAGVGEERHRRAGAGQDEVLDPGQLGLGLLGQVGQPVHARHPGAALQPRRERLGEQPRPGGDADPAGRAQAALGQGRPAEEEHGIGRKQSTVVDHMCRVAGAGARVGGAGAWTGGVGAGRGDGGAVAPGDVGGEDQGGDLAGPGGGDRAHRVVGQVARGAAGVHPAGYGAGQGLDVGLQGGVVADVAGGVGTDDDHHRGPGPAGVVQVGQAVGQAGAEVQQHRGGFPGDPRVPVGGAGGDALEQREHPAHLGHRVQRADEVHLRRARVHETYVDARAGQAGHQGLGADHEDPPAVTARS